MLFKVGTLPADGSEAEETELDFWSTGFDILGVSFHDIVRFVINNKSLSDRHKYTGFNAACLHSTSFICCRNLHE